MMQNWDDMRVFLAVARGESLTAAATALKVDPGTVSRRVARLEEGAGTALFARSPQGYSLTAAGARLVRHAEAAEQAMSAAREDVAGAADALSGQVRIGAPDGCANFVLPQVCAAIGATNPALDLQILALPRVVNLSKREADMAVTVSPPSSQRLSVQKICDYRLHLVAHRDYLAAHPAIHTRADLKGHRIVGYIPDMIFDAELDYLGDLGLQRVPLASNSVAVQFSWVRQGLGLGVVHDFALEAAEGLEQVLPGDVALTRTFYLVRHAEDRRLDRMNRLAAALVAGMRAEIRRAEART
ncbi:LysR family transcriptional regulator [Pseudaestuariivita atlantica]|uniref:LysR family transcriptional regulator n=1 Tax=Pseudaestuariivita atlantica TaxID=1317121 RepID=UPI000D7CACB7|nr:LysR family transcriptional regulator [Pseudaestuariivita atlantica]